MELANLLLVVSAGENEGIASPIELHRVPWEGHLAREDQRYHDAISLRIDL